MWEPPESQGSVPVVYYTVYRAHGGEAFTPIANTEGGLSYLDSAADPFEEYSYYTTATNGIGEGPGSNVVTKPAYPRCHPVILFPNPALHPECVVPLVLKVQTTESTPGGF